VFSAVKRFFDSIIDRDHPNRARKRRALWLGFAAVFVPILILLFFQYRWLNDLGDKTVKLKLAGYSSNSEWFAKQIDYFYTKSAEALELPAAYLDEDPGKLEKYFAKRSPLKWRPPETNEEGKMEMQKGVLGARLIFVKSFQKGPFEKAIYYFDTKKGKTAADIPPEMLKAATMASRYWEVMALGEEPIDTGKSVVDERYPDYPLITNPISDEKGCLRGIVGMIVDIDFFQKELLPFGAEEMLREITRDYGDPNIGLLIANPAGKIVLERGCPIAIQTREEVMQESKSPSFIFSDWRIAFGSDQTTMKRLARNNLAVNLALALVLALTILGGAALALRAASREMKLSEMKNDFVSNVSHELRTPVASIRVFGEMLRLGRATEADKVKEYGEYIETEGRRLTQLINNILDFSKIESGQKEYDLRETAVEDVIQHVLKMLEVRLMHSKARIDCRLPATPLPALRIDAEAIGQALCNLLDNAVKYSEGEPDIAVVVERRDDRVAVSVSDKGIGIPAEELSRVFDRFHRVPTGLVHNVKGSGLGLALVKHIVTAHGGEVRVESKYGKGSVFTIDLPIPTGQQPDTPAPRSATANTELGEQNA